MNKKSFVKRILAVALSIIMVMSIMPIQAFAISYDTYDVSYRTQSEDNRSQIRYGLTDSSAGSFSIDDNGSSVEFWLSLDTGWYLEKWDTWFNGGEDKSWASDPSYDESNPVLGGTYTFTNTYQSGQLTNEKYILVSNLRSLYGDFRIDAVVRPILTVNAGDGISYQISTSNPLTTNLSSNQVAVVYGNDATVNYSVDNEYVVTSVSANYNTNYSENGTVVTVNSIKKPATVTIETRLKQQNVVFNANGGEGTMAQQSYSYGEAQALTANSFTRSDYTFAGWNTKADGTGTAYTDKQSISFTPANDGDSITLYAQWERSNYTVSFDANGGTNTMDAVKVGKNSEYTLPVNGFTAPSAYQFKGWATSANGDVISTESITVTADTTLYAIWEKIPAEAPIVQFSGHLELIYGEFTNQKITVTVEEKEGYAYSYYWVDLASENFDEVVATTDTFNIPDNMSVGAHFYDCAVFATREDNGESSRTIIRDIYVGIKPKEIGIAWSDTDLTYNGSPQKPTATATGTKNGDEITLTVSGEQTDASDTAYTATVTGINGEDAENYKLPRNVTVNFTIAKADQTAPVVNKENETVFGKADGKLTDVSANMEYKAEGENDYTEITGSTVENLVAGKYYVRVEGDSNHNPSPDTEITIAEGRKLTVTVPQNQIGYTLTVDKTEFEYMGGPKITLNIADGYSKTESFAVKINGRDMQWGDFTEISTQGLKEDTVITVEGIADITAPVGEISVKESKWSSFWNNLTFGLFFNETQDVTVTAADSGSGVKSVEYYLSAGELQSDELSLVTEWQPYEGAFKIDPNNCYVIYARITDNAGNAIYINSDGITLDNIAPTLEGIEDGQTYYGDLTVIKSAEQFYDIKVVTLDGEPMGFAEGTYGLVCADNAEHTVVVEDHAGNKTTYTVTVMKNYTVTYKVDGETIYTETVGHGKDATLPAVPNKEGYSGVWDSDGKNITADTTVTAVYSANSYKVSFDANGGEALDSIDLIFGEKYGRLPSSSVTGLSGGNKNWYLVDANGNVTETNIKNLTIVSTARDHKLFIKRNVLAPNVSIALTVPGGISDGYQYYIPGASQRVLTAIVNNANTELLNYTYQWYKDGDPIEGATASVLTLDGNVADAGTYKVEVTATLKEGTGIVVTTSSATGSKEQNVKILRAANTLCYDANGGEGGPQNAFSGGTSLNISTDMPTREHYDFIGWNTKADGSGDSYKAKDSYTFTADGGNGGCTVTLYAQWKAKEYIVTYMADGEVVATVTVGHGENAAFPKVPPKDGYVGKWDRNNENITSDTVINAVYTEIPSIKPDEVKPEDKTDLEDTKKQLEDMQDDDSYTEDDKKAIQDAIDDINDALEVIGNVDDVEKLIDKLPDTIKKEDEAAIKAADDAYNALSDYEKSLVDEGAKKALDDAKAALAELKKPVTDPDKSVVHGSAKTGDNSHIALWLVLFFISGGTLLAITIYNRKRRTYLR